MTEDSEEDDDAANDSGDDHIPGQREVEEVCAKSVQTVQISTTLCKQCAANQYRSVLTMP